jgi:hypothetical protein
MAATLGLFALALPAINVPEKPAARPSATVPPRKVRRLTSPLAIRLSGFWVKSRIRCSLYRCFS